MTVVEAVYRYNKATPDVWQHLIDAVQQQGSLAGMLRLKAAPLLHSGYRLAAPAAGCDLQHLDLAPGTAQQLMGQLVLQVHAGCQRLFGPLPAAPARPVLLQCVVDLLAADWEQLQRSMAAPAVQQGAALEAARAAVLSAITSAAAVAAAAGRGDDRAATAAAAAAADAAAAAVTAAQAVRSLAASTAAPSPASEPAPDEQPGVEPGPVAADTTSAAASSAGPAAPAEQLAQAADLAAAAGDLAAAARPASSTLRRGAGLLVLLRNDWRGKARTLNGSVEVRGEAHTHYSVVQLMSAEGLLLQRGQQQTVSVRVAAEFLGSSSRAAAAAGAWSKLAFNVTVWPKETLLLHSQPPWPIGEKFSSHSAACTKTYEALFGWTPAVIEAALGRLELQQTVTQQRGRRAAGQQQPVPEPELSQESGPTGAAGPEAAAAGAGGITEAVAAVADLALAADAAEAATAYAAACTAVLPLLIAAQAEQAATVIRAGLKQLHQAASSGAVPPPGVLEGVTAALRALPASDAAGEAAAKQSSCSSRKRPSPVAAESAPAAKQQRQQVLEQALPPPDWADARPGVWVRDWFIQQQDTVCMMVQGDGATSDALTFRVRRGAAAQHVRLFRVEEVLAAEGVLVAQYYCNAERSLQQPLQFTARSERLPLEQLRHACYTLAPDDEWEVVQQLLPDQYRELCEHLFWLAARDVQ